MVTEESENQLNKYHQKLFDDLKSTVIIGCNYHTTWQSNSKMRFFLKDVRNGRALLTTRRTNKRFWTEIDSLVFITTRYNIRKAHKIQQEDPESVIIFGSLN